MGPIMAVAATAGGQPSYAVTRCVDGYFGNLHDQGISVGTGSQSVVLGYIVGMASTGWVQ